MNTILITTSSFDTDACADIQDLKASGFKFVTNPFGRKLSEDEVIDLFRHHHPIGMIAGVEPLNRRSLDAAPELKAISRLGVGLDNVDLDAARERGIIVTNTPNAPTQAVAELTLGLILALLRNIAEADRNIRAGQWKALKGRLLEGRTVGLIGLGRIGCRVTSLLDAFGANVIATDPFLDSTPAGVPARIASFDEVLQSADIVSLHIPYSEDTHHIIDKDAIARMKSGACLVNASRGGLIDESALLQALDAETIAGAALDVFENEPYDGPLARHSRVVLTAHMGSATQETRSIMEAESAANLMAALRELGVLT